jgi:invasion protein IalB
MENGSPMIEPTRRRGFREPYGSWKIICTSRRTGRICLRVRRLTSRPSKVIVPEVRS